jgi:hypothetical protein
MSETAVGRARAVVAGPEYADDAGQEVLDQLQVGAVGPHLLTFLGASAARPAGMDAAVLAQREIAESPFRRCVFPHGQHSSAGNGTARRNAASRAC